MMSPETKILKMVQKASGKYYTAEISWRVFGEDDYPRNNKASRILERLAKAKKIKSVKKGRNRFWFARA